MREWQLIETAEHESMPGVEIRGSFLRSQIARILGPRIVAVILIAAAIDGVSVSI